MTYSSPCVQNAKFQPNNFIGAKIQFFFMKLLCNPELLELEEYLSTHSNSLKIYMILEPYSCKLYGSFKSKYKELCKQGCPSRLEPLSDERIISHNRSSISPRKRQRFSESKNDTSMVSRRILFLISGALTNAFNRKFDFYKYTSMSFAKEINMNEVQSFIDRSMGKFLPEIYTSETQSRMWNAIDVCIDLQQSVAFSFVCKNEDGDNPFADEELVEDSFNFCFYNRKYHRILVMAAMVYPSASAEPIWRVPQSMSTATEFSYLNTLLNWKSFRQPLNGLSSFCCNNWLVFIIDNSSNTLNFYPDADIAAMTIFRKRPNTIM
ncbi:hypothetical protein GJ496_008034 [Pomphorhynchus laevis]|nr:hypothetical protein GJ496_008034 [Pomphorhynchus laevis]